MKRPTKATISKMEIAHPAAEYHAKGDVPPEILRAVQRAYPDAVVSDRAKKAAANAIDYLTNSARQEFAMALRGWLLKRKLTRAMHPEAVAALEELIEELR